MSRLLRLVLILCISLTSIALASARGQAMAGGTVVLCSGQAVVVTFGPDGAPVERPQYCPDMVLALISAVADPDAHVALPVVTVPVLFRAVRADGQSLSLIAAQARDPPLVGLG